MDRALEVLGHPSALPHDHVFPRQGKAPLQSAASESLPALLPATASLMFFYLLIGAWHRPSLHPGTHPCPWDSVPIRTTCCRCSAWASREGREVAFFPLPPPPPASTGSCKTCNLHLHPRMRWVGEACWAELPDEAAPGGVGGHPATQGCCRRHEPPLSPSRSLQGAKWQL